MLGNACDRRRWRIKGARVGVAVEIARRSKPQSNFGHRKRGCEATSTPSAFPFFLTLFLTFFEMHLETTWFQGFLLARFRSAHGLKIRIFMLNLSVNFSSVANRSQQFRLLHHQYSINQHRVFLSYFPFSLFTATQILPAEI